MGAEMNETTLFESAVLCLDKNPPLLIVGGTCRIMDTDKHLIHQCEVTKCSDVFFIKGEINQYDFFFREKVISGEQISIYEDGEVIYRHKYYPLPFGKMLPTVYGFMRLKKRKTVYFEIHGGMTIQRYC